MILDEPKKLTPKSKLHPVQKIALGFEIFLVVFLALGGLFKIMSLPFANELLVLSMTSLPILYLFLPILLFRGKKIVDHLFSHLAGLILAIALISILFKWMTWAYWQEMQRVALSLNVSLMLILIALIVYNKQFEKRSFYVRIALRALILLLLVF